MKRIGMAVLLAVLAAGCGGTTVNEMVQQFAPKYCAKLKSCYADDYKSAYPAGDSACVESFTRGFTKEQLDANTACSDDAIDACVKAVDALTCGQTLSDTSVPAACSCK
jgi:hypothetical protein